MSGLEDLVSRHSLKLQFRLDFVEGVGRLLQLLDLLGLQRLADDVSHSIFAQNARQRQENLALNSVLTLEIRKFLY